MDSVIATRIFNKRRETNKDRFSRNQAIRKIFKEKKNFVYHLLNGIAEKKRIDAHAEFSDNGSKAVFLKKGKENIISVIFSYRENGESFNLSLNLKNPNIKELFTIDLRDENIRKKIEGFAEMVI